MRKLHSKAWPSDAKDTFQLGLQLCLATQRSVSIKVHRVHYFYQNTTITVNGVEHQTLEKKENGLNDSQQQLQYYINATRLKIRPQDAQTKYLKFRRTERTSRCASDINLHCALTSPNFWIKMFHVTFWCSALRFF